MITKKQRNAFWRLFGAACSEQGIPASQRDDYRHQILKEYSGNEHLANLGKMGGYESVMARLAEDANDFEAAAYWTNANSRRYNSMAEDCARQIFEICNQPGCDPKGYVQAILKQSHLATTLEGGASWLDVPEDDLPKLFMMLDTERRRMLKQLEAEPLAYQYGRSWSWAIGYLTHYDLPSAPPPPVFINRREQTEAAHA